MTGEEFYNKVKNFKEITELDYEVTGSEECPDSVRVFFVADGERMSLLLGKPSTEHKPDYDQTVWIGLVLNKIMELQGRTERICVANGDDIVNHINYARECVRNHNRIEAN